ncbi:protein kinase domain-containing protein [Sorangium sp. So ce861]|uniref:serine/threonine-protein kinase n=1 Tax=Sorangium sp. So ce861 TaxID=3133323 RepID=UPI003F60CB87
MSGSETKQPSLAPVEPGTVLAGKYRVERIIGQGGMGVVVEARHIVLDERVALKFLLPAFTEHPEGSARFLREAKAGMRIKSEHVARVSDVGTLENGAPYMVMELLTGSDLARLLRDQGVLGLEDAVDYIVQGSEAIAEAHGLGIVHRDLKPANLFLTARADGSPLVKVLDFGISKMTTGAVDVLTGTDAALGSALYMSPEQMRQTRSVDHRTDIYALGVSLYELLAGRQPYYAETLPQLCSEVLTGTPTPLRDLRPDAPVPLAMVLEKAYARDREQRYASVAELVVALAPFAPARTYPTLVRIARMGGLSLHAAAAGGHRASQPSFSSVDARASAPALREPSWPGFPSPGVAGHADAAPSPRNATLPGAGSPLSRPPVAQATTPFPHPSSPFSRPPSPVAPATTPFPHPPSPFSRGSSPGVPPGDGGWPSPAPPGDGGRPSPVPPDGFSPHQQIVPGPYSAPMSSRAAATFASSTHLGISSDGRRLPGLPASPAVVIAIALLSATLVLGVLAVGVFMLRGRDADDADGARSAAASATEAASATATAAPAPAPEPPVPGAGAATPEQPTILPTGAATAAAAASASAPASASASAPASAPTRAASPRAPAGRGGSAARTSPAPSTQRPPRGIDLNDPH